MQRNIVDINKGINWKLISKVVALKIGIEGETNKATITIQYKMYISMVGVPIKKI